MIRERFEVQEKILNLLRKAARAAFCNKHQDVITCQWQVLVLSVAAHPIQQPEIASTITYQGKEYSPQALVDNTIKYVVDYRVDQFVWEHPDLLLRRAIELFGRERGKEVVQYGLSYVVRG